MRRGTERKLLFIGLFTTFLLLWSMMPKSEKRIGPMLFVVTATSFGAEQQQKLTQLAQMLRLVPNVQWFVIENRTSASTDVKDILERSGLPYTHLWVKSNRDLPLKQYNYALRWLRELRTEKYIYEEDFDSKGFLLFADESFIYDTRLFDQIRTASKVVAWPIGHRDSVMQIENSPWNPNGDLIEEWMPLKLAGFAFKVHLIFLRPRAEIPEDAGESFAVGSLLRGLGITPDEVELIVRGSHEVEQKDHADFLVWET